MVDLESAHVGSGVFRPHLSQDLLELGFGWDFGYFPGFLEILFAEYVVVLLVLLFLLLQSSL